MRIRSLIAALLAAGLVQGCASCDDVPEGAVTSCEQTPPVATAVKTDILFVIDDSQSMDPEQDLLRQALSAFIDDLVASPVQLDFRIGVTTTSVQDFSDQTGTNEERYVSGGTPYPDGALVAVDASSIDLADPATWGSFLWTSDAGAADPGFYGPRVMDWTSATLVEDFKANVLVGTNGTGREQPFEAMRLALTRQFDDPFQLQPPLGPAGENAGFLRSGARLGVVFISDEDDCSGPMDPLVTNSAGCRTQKVATPSVLTPVSDYADFLNGPIGGEVRDPIVAAVVGLNPTTLTPSCAANCGDPTCTGATDGGDRFLALLGGLPAERTIKGSVCDASFGATLTSIACALVPQDVPLDSEPADWGMMAVGVKSGGTTVACHIVMAGDAAENDPETDVVVHEATGGQPAFLHFQNACRLGCGKQIQISLICAG